MSTIYLKHVTNNTNAHHTFLAVDYIIYSPIICPMSKKNKKKNKFYDFKKKRWTFYLKWFLLLL
jgi:hypothetical protein